MVTQSSTWHFGTNILPRLNVQRSEPSNDVTSLANDRASFSRDVVLPTLPNNESTTIRYCIRTSPLQDVSISFSAPAYALNNTSNRSEATSGSDAADDLAALCSGYDLVVWRPPQRAGRLSRVGVKSLLRHNGSLSDRQKRHLSVLQRNVEAGFDQPAPKSSELPPSSTNSKVLKKLKNVNRLRRATEDTNHVWTSSVFHFCPNAFQKKTDFATTRTGTLKQLSCQDATLAR